MLSKVVRTISTYSRARHGAPGRPALVRAQTPSAGQPVGSCPRRNCPRGGRKVQGGSSSQGAAAWPLASSAEAHRPGPLPAGRHPRTRRQAVTAATHPGLTALAGPDQTVLLAPGHPVAAQRSPSRVVRPRFAAGAPPWTLIFHGKDPAPIGRTGRSRLVPPSVAAVHQTGCQRHRPQ